MHLRWLDMLAAKTLVCDHWRPAIADFKPPMQLESHPCFGDSLAKSRHIGPKWGVQSRPAELSDGMVSATLFHLHLRTASSTCLPTKGRQKKINSNSRTTAQTRSPPTSASRSHEEALRAPGPDNADMGATAEAEGTRAEAAAAVPASQRRCARPLRLLAELLGSFAARGCGVCAAAADLRAPVPVAAHLALGRWA